MPKKRTQEETLIAFREKHGDKWGYEKFKYVNNNSLATITCQIHGDFEMQPKLHLRGYGCPKCGRAQSAKTRTHTTDAFISKAHELHGDKYGYREVKYVNSRKEVEILCSKHGKFLQKPVVHLQGRGCPQCGLESNFGARITEDEFFERCNKVHNNKYDYSKVVYSGALQETTIDIICPVHGVFSQNAGFHLHGSGCKKCAGVEKITTDQFVAQARLVHSDIYTYTKTKYVNAYTKVIITCKEHGDFEQKPNNHKNGQGCPKCTKYGYDVKKIGYFYVVKLDSFIGFGVSNDLKQRLDQHRRSTKDLSTSMEVVLSFYGDGEDILSFERNLKRRLKHMIAGIGINGFVTECLPVSCFNALIEDIKENLPEGRFVEL